MVVSAPDGVRVALRWGDRGWERHDLAPGQQPATVAPGPPIPDSAGITVPAAVLRPPAPTEAEVELVL